MAELAKRFHPDMAVTLTLDTTVPVTEGAWESLEEKLSLAHDEPDSPIRVILSICGWVDQKGPCYHSVNHDKVYARLADLARADWGFTGATPTGIDHVLVRGLPAGQPERWPPERRRLDGRLLSDHAPVDREVG